MKEFYNPKNGKGIKEWADERSKEMRKEIDFYIDKGIEKSKAVEMVLSESTIGAGYNGQIRYEYR